MHLYSDSNLNSFQRRHSAAPTPDPLNLLLSSPQVWLLRRLFAMPYPLHTFCSTGIQQTIKTEPFPISFSCVFPNMSAEWPTSDLPSRARFEITNHMFNEGDEEALWAYKLSPHLCHSFIQPFPPISHPVRCRATCLRLHSVIASPLHYGWDPPYVHPYMWHASVR